MTTNSSTLWPNISFMQSATITPSKCASGVPITVCHSQHFQRQCQRRHQTQLFVHQSTCNDERMSAKHCHVPFGVHAQSHHKAKSHDTEASGSTAALCLHPQSPSSEQFSQWTQNNVTLSLVVSLHALRNLLLFPVFFSINKHTLKIPTRFLCSESAEVDNTDEDCEDKDCKCNSDVFCEL